MQILSDLGILTSAEVIIKICDKMEVTLYLRLLLINHDQNFT